MYPSITGHPPTAGLMSILEQYDNTKSWIYSNFVQIVCAVRSEGSFSGTIDLSILPGFYGYACCPWIACSFIKRETVSRFSSSIIDFIINCLDTDNYIYMVVDQSFLLKTGISNRFSHDIFIYGYDNEKQVFHVGDFTFTGKFSFEQVPFIEIEAGYNTDVEDFINYGRGGVGLWTFFGNIDYKFDSSFVKEQLFELRNSFDISEKYRGVTNRIVSSQAYGFNAYSLLAQFIQSSMERQYGSLKCIHNLYDHKVIMVQRLEFMSKNGFIHNPDDIISQYKYIKDEFLGLSNLFVKYTMRQDVKSIERHIPKKLKDIGEIEKTIVDRIIESIVV